MKYFDDPKPFLKYNKIVFTRREINLSTVVLPMPFKQPAPALFYPGILPRPVSPPRLVLHTAVSPS